MTNKLSEYTHKPALHPDVIEAITSIYQELSKADLLERCLGGYIQNSNESLNALIWTFAPKTTFSGAKCVEIAVNIASSIFNNGYSSILLMMNTMNIIIGPVTASICEELDEERISIAEARSRHLKKVVFRGDRAKQEATMRGIIIMKLIWQISGKNKKKLHYII